MMQRMVYVFGDGKADGNQGLKNLLGGKGANLAEMTLLGLPVPPGFTITTDVCTHFYKNNRAYLPGLEKEVDRAMQKIEELVGARFGDSKNPLLVSVRSGARASMPGMMDTILNLGLNDETVAGLCRQSDNERFAYDAYRRFIQMYADVVLGVSSHHFETLLEQARRNRQVQSDAELGVQDLKNLVNEFKRVVLHETSQTFPLDAKAQLWGAIGAVFGSWMSSRAISYRRIHKIPEDWGTAVNVQAMVFGNMGADSATGVAFTRDPGTGEKRFFGEYLVNAQGEDVVAGIRTPQPINRESSTDSEAKTLEEIFPKTYSQLVTVYRNLEKHYQDMQDIEFTIQKGKLYLLQTRTGKRTASAAVRIAVDMVNEKLIDKEEAIARVTPAQLEQLLHPRLDPRVPKKIIAKGLPASPGAASGTVVFSSEEAETERKAGRDVILVRHETSPEDIAGMDAARGILTALGGMTSHAAVVARGMGKPCVAGCGSINIDYRKQQFTVGELVIQRGNTITLDGATGEVIEGHVPTVNSQVDQYFTEFMNWVDEFRKLRVRANAETPNDVKVARQFGAEGVGLCRTEHMFFEESRIAAVREMILSETRPQREVALQKIFPMQRDDFIAIFKEMKGYPVTIRLLDPPLHEFLPHTREEMEELAHMMNTAVDNIEAKVKALHEFNPMLGNRGCRLGISYPEIYRMQVRAIMDAACFLVTKKDFKIVPEIMLPFIATVEEFKLLREEVVQVCNEVMAQHKVNIDYLLGTMIEIPRAALIADDLAKEAHFFSFGTNDLTQMTLGLSRDDAGSFLPRYVEKGIFKQDPFVTIDQRGVGELIKFACERGRKSAPNLKIGICGEHGGDTETIGFCHRMGFDYVSCSPFRVPVARLSAARAQLAKKEVSSTD
ncbi:MAG: pyruvate, phosphate dikinase [Deltaproteobacteria bacterium]|nr:pyruvate, phosphate dikinase [Deltaproteobacteria bacterium]